MKRINRTVLSVGILLGAFAHAHGQGFTNLDFEKARIVNPAPGFGFLDWNVAVPGWSHSSGNDTGTVYYGSEHFGLTQYYLLVDARSPSYAPGSQLAGRYSLSFASGSEKPNDISPWVNAYISQSGLIPEGTRSLQMLATGPFKVLVGGSDIPMYPMGGNSYAGDITTFGGSSAEVRIMNTATAVHTPTVVDNISFSSVVVPEPSSVALLVAGAALLCHRRSPRRSPKT